MAENEEVRFVDEREARREELRRRFREGTILAAPHSALMGFLDFVRERGVVGLAIGFVLGGAVSKVTTSFSTDILSPLIALIFGSTEGLAEFTVGSVAIGKFAATIIDFLVLALAVYLIFKVLKLDRLDKPKE